MYSTGCSRIGFVDQAGLDLRNTIASASKMLGLKCVLPGPFVNCNALKNNFALFHFYTLKIKISSMILSLVAKLSNLLNVHLFLVKNGIKLKIVRLILPFSN